MTANHNYYEIDIADIWLYEQNEFLSDKSSDDLAKKIINKAEEIIIKKGEESFIVDLDYAKSRSYYVRNLNEYQEFSNTLKGRYKTNFFFNKQVCYQYDQHIIISQDSPDFEFWFALKLKQYDTKLIELSNYLDFQKQSNFNNDTARINSFLKIVTKQFKDDLLSGRVIEIVEDWIENHSATSTVEKKVHLVDDRIILRIKYDRTKLFEVLKPYFDDKEYEKLKSLLSENEIKDKICFNSNANQFVMVFRQLHLNNQIIGKLVNTEKWICKYFTYYGQNKKYTDFNKENVHKILTKGFYDIAKSKRIELPGLGYIKNK